MNRTQPLADRRTDETPAGRTRHARLPSAGTRRSDRDLNWNPDWDRDMTGAGCLASLRHRPDLCWWNRALWRCRRSPLPSGDVVRPSPSLMADVGRSPLRLLSAQFSPSVFVRLPSPSRFPVSSLSLLSPRLSLVFVSYSRHFRVRLRPCQLLKTTDEPQWRLCYLSCCSSSERHTSAASAASERATVSVPRSVQPLSGSRPAVLSPSRWQQCLSSAGTVAGAGAGAVVCSAAAATAPGAAADTVRDGPER